MQKLNELVELAKAYQSAPCSITYLALARACEPETIAALAKAYSALEQRAEAAEAKLQELEKQEPVAFGLTPETLGKPLFTRPAPAVSQAELENFALYMADESVKSGNYPDGWQCKASNAAHEYLEASRDHILRNIEQRDLDAKRTAFITRPAPAVSLAELVPDTPNEEDAVDLILSGWGDDFISGCAWFRTAMLRNIEGAQKK